MLPWLEEQGVPPLVLLGGPRVLRVHEPGVSYVSSTGEVLLEGADACVLACGAQVGEALAAALDLHTQSIRIEVVSLSTLAPLDTELVCRSAERHPALLVAEAPPPDGIRGLHARVCDALGGREVAAVSRPPDRAEGREGRSEDRSEDRLAGPTAADIRAAVTRLTGEIDTKPVRPGETP
jgi:transketolase